MADRFIESHIRQVPLFARIPAEQLQWIVEAFEIMRFDAGEIIFRQGEPNRGMSVIVSGRAQITQTDELGNAHPMGYVTAGKYVNEIALFRAEPESATLRVLETTTLLFLSRRRLVDVLTHHPDVSPYLPMPEDTSRTKSSEKVYSWQRDNEALVLDTRRHWFAYVRKIWMALTIAIIIIVIDVLLPISTLTIVIILLATIIPGLYMFYNYLEWRNDHFIITSQRVIHIEHNILLFKSSLSEIPLASIQEVNADNITADPFSRVFNYGTVEIKTAGDSGNMLLTLMEDPDRIQEMVFNQRQRQHENQERQHLNTIRATVDRAIGRGDDDHPEQDNAPEAAPTTGGKPRFVSPFATRYINEKNEIVYRKALIFLMRGTLIPAFGLSISIGAFLISFGLPLGVIGSFLALIPMTIFAVWWYWVYWDWRHDLYIIGSSTIQLIHQRPLWLQNEADQILLASVDNVVSQQSGFLQTLLRYGNVRISLIGSDTSGAKVFRGVSRPQNIQAEITGRQARMRQRAKEAEERRRRDEIAEYLSVYHDTVGVAMPDAQPVRGAPSATATNGALYGQVRHLPDRMRPPKVPRVRLRE